MSTPRKLDMTHALSMNKLLDINMMAFFSSSDMSSFHKFWNGIASVLYDFISLKMGLRQYFISFEMRLHLLFASFEMGATPHCSISKLMKCWCHPVSKLMRCKGYPISKLMKCWHHPISKLLHVAAGKYYCHQMSSQLFIDRASIMSNFWGVGLTIIHYCVSIS